MNIGFAVCAAVAQAVFFCVECISPIPAGKGGCLGHIGFLLFFDSNPKEGMIGQLVMGAETMRDMKGEWVHVLVHATILLESFKYGIG